MKRTFWLSTLAAVLCAAAPAAQSLARLGAALSAVEGQAQNPRPVFRSNTQLVSVDVIVRDNSGAIVRGLKAADFEVTEDGKAMEIRSFSFEEIKSKPQAIETAELLAGAKDKLAQETGKTAAPAAAAATAASAPVEAPKPMTSEELAGRRLIVLLFDIASMQPEDVQRAVDSATTFVQKNMTPADMVAVATISSNLDVLNDFTSDRTVVGNALAKLGYKEGTATPPPTADTVSTDEAQNQDDTSSQDTSDMTLSTTTSGCAPKVLAETLAPIIGVSILHFSAGGSAAADNFRCVATNAAVRAHVTITGSTRAVCKPSSPAATPAVPAAAHAVFRAPTSAVSSRSCRPETRSDRSRATPAPRLPRLNDFAPAFERIQNDMSAYYRSATRRPISQGRPVQNIRCRSRT